MWIRSQDRNMLINESYFRIYKERKEYSICSRVEALGTYSTEKKESSDPLAYEAIKTLDLELDNYDAWKNWKYSRLLNPHEEGVVWTIDPRWISNSYKSLYVKKAYKLFHKYPFTACPIVCWFIIKRNELDNIRTASESLRLSIDSSQAMQMTGALEVING